MHLAGESKERLVMDHEVNGIPSFFEVWSGGEGCGP
jgi:hypothetical protein